jgi:hypothetical protein
MKTWRLGRYENVTTSDGGTWSPPSCPPAARCLRARRGQPARWPELSESLCTSECGTRRSARPVLTLQRRRLADVSPRGGGGGGGNGLSYDPGLRPTSGR